MKPKIPELFYQYVHKPLRKFAKGFRTMGWFGHSVYWSFTLLWRLAWTAAAKIVMPFRLFSYALKNVTPARKKTLIVVGLSDESYRLDERLALLLSSLAICEVDEFAKVDFCFVKQENASWLGASEAASNSVWADTLDLMRLTQFLPQLGSLMAFGSTSDFERFRLQQGSSYQIWSASTVTRQELTLNSLNLCASQFRKTGRFPTLQSRLADKRWATTFLHQVATNEIPITVCIDDHFLEKGRLQLWIDLFAYCSGKYPIRFLVLPTARDVETALRPLTNLVFCRDHNVNLHQEFALIDAAAAYLGGPDPRSLMAVCGRAPYMLVDWPSRLLGSATEPGQNAGTYRYSWAAAKQQLIPEALMISAIAGPFEQVTAGISAAEWAQPLEQAEDARNVSVKIW
jgi:hypothetical protein